MALTQYQGTTNKAVVSASVATNGFSIPASQVEQDNLWQAGVFKRNSNDRLPTNRKWKYQFLSWSNSND